MYVYIVKKLTLQNQINTIYFFYCVLLYFILYSIINNKCYKLISYGYVIFLKMSHFQFFSELPVKI